MNNFKFREFQIRNASLIARREKFAQTAAQTATTAKFKNFKDGFEHLNGAAREKWVLDYVKSGKVPKPKLVPITITKNGATITYEVMPSYFTIEGMPVQVNAITAEEIMKYFGLNLPTREIIGQLHDNAKYKIPGKPDMGKLADTGSNMIAYNAEMEKQRASKGINPNPGDIVVGEYKEYTMPHDGTNVHAVGWYNPAGAKDKTNPHQWMQNYTGSTMHPPTYADYSTVPRGVGNVTVKNDKTGETTVTSLDDFLNNPKYKDFKGAVANPDAKYGSYKATDKKESPKQPVNTGTVAPQTQQMPQPAGNVATIPQEEAFIDKLKKLV